jgi:alanyl-tRNA synthetase
MDDLFLVVSEGSIGSGVRRIEAVTGDAALRRTLEWDKLLRGLASRLRVPVGQLPLWVEALATRAARHGAPGQDGRAGRNGRAEHGVLVAGSLADSVRISASGHRYLVASEPGIALRDLPAQARRLTRDLDAVVVLLLPDPEEGTLRVGVGVPASLAGQVPATSVLDQVLAVTGGRGGGSTLFAQGGGTSSDDLPGTVSRVWAALGLGPATR